MDRDSTSPTQSMTDPTATAEPSLKRAHHDDDHQSPVPSSSHLEAASSSANMLSSEKGAQKRPRLPISTQVTKSDLPSPGANEVTILPGLVLPLNEEVLRTFFQYSHDRHDVFLKRKQGKPQEEWTDDPVFKSTKFANVYRVLDRLTQYVLTRVVQTARSSSKRSAFVCSSSARSRASVPTRSFALLLEGLQHWPTSRLRPTKTSSCPTSALVTPSMAVRTSSQRRESLGQSTHISRHYASSIL